MYLKFTSDPVKIHCKHLFQCLAEESPTLLKIVFPKQQNTFSSRQLKFFTFICKEHSNVDNNPWIFSAINFASSLVFLMSIQLLKLVLLNKQNLKLHLHLLKCCCIMYSLLLNNILLLF